MGDRVDVAFHAQINEYRGTRTVQLSLIDLRPTDPTELFDRFAAGQALSEDERRALAPNRADVIRIWQYLRATLPAGAVLRCDLRELCLAVAASANGWHSIRKTPAGLAILQELGFLTLRREGGAIELRLLPESRPNPLENSQIYHTLRGECDGNL